MAKKLFEVMHEAIEEAEKKNLNLKIEQY
jgi:hypothetical protein